MDFISIFNKYLSLIEFDHHFDKNKFYIFYKFYKLKNPELNFSRLEHIKTIIRKHFIDSILVSKILRMNNIDLKEPIMDLGSGGGFPGIPLAILHPKKKFLLVESKKKRVEYLKEVKELLQLNNVEIFHKTLTSKDEIICQTIITRAFETMCETAIRVSLSLEQNGYLIFMKGPNCKKEIREMNYNDYKKILEYDYLLPSESKKHQDFRKLIIFQKLTERKELSSFEKKFFNFPFHNKIRIIESADNTVYKKIKKVLTSSKSIKKEKFTIIAGEKIVNEFISKYPEKILQFFFTKDLDNEKLNQYYNILKKYSIEFIFLSKHLLDNLEINEFLPPFLAVKVSEIEPFNKIHFEKAIVLPVKDPLNLGSAIRSILAFGINHILLTKESCNPYLWKSIRSSSGYVFDCKFFFVEDLISFLKNLNHRIYILTLKGEDIRNIKDSSPYVLILGEEGKGIPENIENLNLSNIKKIKIPINHYVDSLNVSVSCGIALFYLEIFKKP